MFPLYLFQSRIGRIVCRAHLVLPPFPLQAFTPYSPISNKVMCLSLMLRDESRFCFYLSLLFFLIRLLEGQFAVLL
jgi:hypothetical protein